MIQGIINTYYLGHIFMCAVGRRGGFSELLERKEWGLKNLYTQIFKDSKPNRKVNQNKKLRNGQAVVLHAHTQTHTCSTLHII